MSERPADVEAEMNCIYFCGTAAAIGRALLVRINVEIDIYRKQFGATLKSVLLRSVSSAAAIVDCKH